MRLSASTRVAAVIGDPVSHSLSPAIHNAAYDAIGLDWVYVALPVAAGRGFEAVRALPALGVAGVNVTMPHKAAAAEACDELSDDAKTLGAANTVVVRADGTRFGDSTDGDGLLDVLREQGVDPRGRRIVVLGAGGAARAIVLALGRAGAEVNVAARRLEAATDAAALAPGAVAGAWGALDDLVARADVVVNATPLGMGGEPPPFDVEVLGPGRLVVDTVYHPLETRLLAAARARGAEVVNGVGMLVGQAARSFAVLTGVDAPVAVMRLAAEMAIGGSRA